VSDALPARALGALEVPSVGFGAMVLTGVYGGGRADPASADAAMAAAVDAGCTFFDTSDSYRGNEEVIGEFLRGRRRDELVIGTKFGLRVPDGEPVHEVPVPWDGGGFAVNAEPRLVRRYLEDSLARLGTDHVDLYYPHFPDPAVPIEATVEAIAELVAEGLVRHVGLSNPTEDDLRRAQRVHPIAAVQVEWSMWHPIEAGLRARCVETGTGVVAWSPLGRGFLTGTVTDLGARDFRARVDRLTGANLAANNDRYRPVVAIAHELGVTPAQLALAWLLHQTDVVVAMPGSRTPAHIRENAAAGRLALDASTLATIDAALASFDPVGDTT
jgi:aryl-alcohol dehydrogenase-like predicted oxidoreductase